MALAFNTPTDIGNRGLQHLGAKRMDPLVGFAENSKNAKSIAFVYDKAREAELRRNAWSFATKRVVLRALDTTTRFLAPTLYSSTETYFVNSIVSDVSGMLWISTIPDNVGNAPGGSLAWEAYFGPITVQPYDSTTTYSSGELVYKAPGDGTYKVYLSSVSGNAADPSAATAWASDASYTNDVVVSYSSRLWISLIDLNVGQVPTGSPSTWNVATTYGLGNAVAGSDGANYTCVLGPTTGNDPTLDSGVHWHNTGVLTAWQDVTSTGLGSDQYLALNVALRTQPLAFPIGAGPLSDRGTLNAFFLPPGCLKILPQHPKTGSSGQLGGSFYAPYADWLKESNYLITQDAGPLLVRFTGNVTQVTAMDAMFCEGLAARIAIETCEEITQSDSKLSTCEQLYGKWMGDARTVNAIEADEAFEPAEDEFITCRL